jgi:hypothetical protein
MSASMYTSFGRFVRNLALGAIFFALGLLFWWWMLGMPPWR